MIFIFADVAWKNIYVINTKKQLMGFITKMRGSYLMKFLRNANFADTNRLHWDHIIETMTMKIDTLLLPNIKRMKNFERRYNISPNSTPFAAKNLLQAVVQRAPQGVLRM